MTLPALQKIYVITLLEGPKKGPVTGGWIPEKGAQKRAWAWHPTLEEAKKDCLDQSLDLFEGGTFQFAVIEAVEPGWCVAEQVAWFVCSRMPSLRVEKAPPGGQEKSLLDYNFAVRECEQPVWARNTVNWGLG